MHRHSSSNISCIQLLSQCTMSLWFKQINHISFLAPHCTTSQAAVIKIRVLWRSPCLLKQRNWRNECTNGIFQFQQRNGRRCTYIAAFCWVSFVQSGRLDPVTTEGGLQRLQVVSSVLFLTEAGGPTLVLDQDPKGPLADRGWLVQPCPNQLLAFKGNLLHGVIPGTFSCHSSPCRSTPCGLCHLKPAECIVRSLAKPQQDAASGKVALHQHMAVSISSIIYLPGRKVQH